MPAELPELTTHLSGNDALSLLGIIHRSIDCDSTEDFKGLVQGVQELLTCDFAIAALGYRDETGGVVIVDGVNISFPEEWCAVYKAENYLRFDPVVNEHFTTYEPQSWSQARRRIINNESQNKIASLCMDFNMKEGYTVGSKPFPPENTGSMFCFSGRSMKNDKRTEAILDCITPHLHLALSGILGKRGAPNDAISLSNREREVLDWLKQGKSS